MIIFRLCETEDNGKAHHSAGLALCDELLERYCGIEKASSEISLTEKGKPFIIGKNAPSFSISHSAHLALCAVSITDSSKDFDAFPAENGCKIEVNRDYCFSGTPSCANIGADIELMNRSNDEARLSKISERFFHPNEIEYIKNDIANLFFEVWTRKESRGKADGVGLHGMLAEYDSMSDDSALFYSFKAAFEDEEYCITICAK